MYSMKFNRSKTSESLFLMSHNDGTKEKFMNPEKLSRSCDIRKLIGSRVYGEE